MIHQTVRAKYTQTNNEPSLCLFKLKCVVTELSTTYEISLNNKHGTLYICACPINFLLRPGFSAWFYKPIQLLTVLLSSSLRAGEPPWPALPLFNESCIPSSHVASCTVLNWATVTRNGEVAQRLFVHENRLVSAVCTGGPQNGSWLRKRLYCRLARWHISACILWKSCCTKHLQTLQLFGFIISPPCFIQSTKSCNCCYNSLTLIKVICVNEV